MLAVNVCFFWNIWTGRSAFYFRDVVVNYFPLKMFLRDRFLTDTWPLWTERLNSGQPVWADPVNAILYPGQILLLLFDDPVYAYGMLTVLHFLFAQAGFYLWLKSERFSSAGSVFGSLLIAYSGVFLNTHAALQYLFAWSWCGWYLCALNRFHDRPSWRTGALTTLCLWAIVVSGELQTVMILGALTVGVSLAGSRPDALKRLGGASLILGIAACSAAPFLLPLYELSLHAARGYENSLKLVTEWSFHPLRILEWFVPGIFGLPASDPVWWANGINRASNWGFYTLTSGIAISGIPVAAIGICRMHKRGSYNGWFWFILGAVAFVAACGDWLPFYRLLYDFIPLWHMFKFPERLLFWVTLAAGWYAAGGFDLLSMDDRPKRSVLCATGAAAIGAALIVCAGQVSLVGSIVGTAGGTTGMQDPELLRQVSGSFRTAGICWLLVSAAIACLFSFRNRSLPLLFVPVTVIILVYSFSLFVPLWPKTTYETSPGAVTSLVRSFPETGQPSPYPLRVNSSLFVTQLKTYAPQKEGRLISLMTWDTLMGNLMLITPWSDMLGYNSSEIYSFRMMRDLANIANFSTLTNTGYLALFPDNAGKTPSLTCGELIPDSGSPGLLWCRNSHALPPVWCPGNWKIPASSDDLVHSYRATNFAATGPGFAYLGSFDRRMPQPNGDWPPPSDGDHANLSTSCSPLRWDEEDRTVLVDKGFDGPVVLRDMNYPGWKASVGGTDIPVLSVNGGLLGAWVPAGRREVRFEFEPVSIRIGFVIAAATVLVAFFVFVFPDLKRRTS